MVLKTEVFIMQLPLKCVIVCLTIIGTCFIRRLTACFYMDKRQIKKALADSLVGIKRVLEDCQSDDVDDPGDDSEPRRVAVDPASFQFTPSRASWKEQKSLFGPSASVSTSKRKGKKRASLFTAPYKDRSEGQSSSRTWTRKFICLRLRDCDMAPKGKNKADLTRMKLGEKRLTLNLCMSAKEVDDCLKEAYPALQSAGGYTLLVTDRENSSRSLVPLKGPYNAMSLKSQTEVHNIYVRPLQSSITQFDYTSSDEESQSAEVM